MKNIFFVILMSVAHIVSGFSTDERTTLEVVSADQTGQLMSFDVFAHLPAYDKEAIEDKLLNMQSIVQPQFDNDVEAYLRSYLTYGYRDAQRTLGRSVLYMPMIEHYLALRNMPDQLKYLPIIESSFRPYAESTAGAAGLWQFMRGTAKEKGLLINSEVDERKDPYKSTIAALDLLNELYKNYHNWELALAAYNCGKGNVNKAIRRSGGYTDYHKIKQFLPRETRRYIPRFIAATYLAQYFFEHGLQPEWPDFERQWTRTTQVYDYISFSSIVRHTGVDIEVLKELNPAYRKGYIPRNENGNFLVLPNFAMDAYHQWKTPAPITMKEGIEKDRYFQSTYTVLSGDNLEKLARSYNCTIEDIKMWNNLTNDELYYRQQLILFHKKTAVWRNYGA